MNKGIIIVVAFFSFFKLFIEEFYKSFLSLATARSLFYILANILVVSLLYVYFYKKKVLTTLKTLIIPIFCATIIANIAYSLLGLIFGRFVLQKMNIEMPEISSLICVIQVVLLSTITILLIRNNSKKVTVVLGVVLLILVMGSTTNLFSQANLLVQAAILSLGYVNIHFFPTLDLTTGAFIILLLYSVLFVTIEVLALKLILIHSKKLEISYKKLFVMLLISTLITSGIMIGLEYIKP